MKRQMFGIVSLTLLSTMMLLAGLWHREGRNSHTPGLAVAATPDVALVEPVRPETRSTVQIQPAEGALLSQNAYVWRIQTVDSDRVGWDTSLALDAAGHPHISYYDYGNGNLKYAHLIDSTWNIQTLDNGEDVGEYSSLTLNAASRPHISYLDRANEGLRYTHQTGTAWEYQTLDSGYAGWDNSLVLDVYGRPHISYSRWFNLKYAHWTGSYWSIQTIEETRLMGAGTSLALDSDQHAHIVYSNYPARDLKYAHWTGSVWDSQRLDRARGYCLYPSLVLDSKGYPHVSYSKYPDRELRYAHWTGSAWSIQTVNSIIDVGYRTSLALDTNDYPHISYYDDTNDWLKYARWTGSTWLIDIVDVGGGWDSSLVLDSMGHPHISYHDRVNRALKYAVGYVRPDLSSSVKMTNQVRVEAGDTITYTIRLVNRGDPYLVTPFILTDPIPLHTTYVPGSAWAGGGEITDADGIIWTGVFVGGTSLTATLAVRVDTTLTQPTAIVNIATLTGDPTGLLALRAAVIVKPLETFLPLTFKGE